MNSLPPSTPPTPPSPRWPTDPHILEKQVEWTFLRGSGPGGQHRNKVETGVRLHHPPSGVTVTATEGRSQKRNRDLAMARLVDKLRKLNFVPRKRINTKPTRGSVRRRLDAKRRRSETKNRRGKPED